MPRIVNARVTRMDGVEFEAKIANLTLASVFLITSEPLAFRQRLQIAMFGVVVDAEVAFVLSRPKLGAVVSFVARRAVRDVLASHLGDIEALEVAFTASGAMEEIWGEPTTTAPLPGLGRGELDAESGRAAIAAAAAMTAELPSLLPGALPPVLPLPSDPVPPPPPGAVGPTASEIAMASISTNPSPVASVKATRDSQENLRWNDRTAPHTMGAEIAATADEVRMSKESLDVETVDELKLDIDTLIPKVDEFDQSMEQIDCKTPQNMPVMHAPPDLYKRPPLLPKKEAPKTKPRAKREEPTIPDVPMESLGIAPGALPKIAGAEKIAPDPADSPSPSRRSRG